MKILLDENFSPLSIMNRFTVEPATQRRRAGKSWLNTQNAYADDLYQYKVFLNAIELEEGDVLLDDLRDYASCFTEGVSVRTRRRFSAATVVRRLGTAIRYHKFRIYKGLPSSVSLNELNSSGGFREGRLYSDPDSPYAAAPKDADAADKIRPFLDTSWIRVFDILGPAVSVNCGRSQRNRLACEISLLTGMRIDEVCSLKLTQINSLTRHVDPAQPSKLIPLRITKTKGLKPGDVFFPAFLVSRLQNYIAGERQQAIERARSVRADLSSDEYLFVNGLKSSHSTAGNPLSTDTLSRAFSGACIEAGLLETVESYVLDTDGSPRRSSDGAYLMAESVVSAHTFHDLRHTFAMMTYRDLASLGLEEPWKQVQLRLRHSSILTTLRSYLNWLDRAEQSLSDALLDTFRAIDDFGGDWS